jgi:hypothetical protein
MTPLDVTRNELAALAGYQGTSDPRKKLLLEHNYRSQERKTCHHCDRTQGLAAETGYCSECGVNVALSEIYRAAKSEPLNVNALLEMIEAKQPLVVKFQKRQRQRQTRRRERLRKNVKKQEAEYDLDYEPESEEESEEEESSSSSSESEEEEICYEYAIPKPKRVSTFKPPVKKRKLVHA